MFLSLYFYTNAYFIHCGRLNFYGDKDLSIKSVINFYGRWYPKQVYRRHSIRKENSFSSSCNNINTDCCHFLNYDFLISYFFWRSDYGFSLTLLNLNFYIWYLILTKRRFRYHIYIGDRDYSLVSSPISSPSPLLRGGRNLFV